MRIAGQDFSEQLIGRIRSRVQHDPSLTRTRLSREVCEWLEWRDPQGRLKPMSCRVALLKLARSRLIELPEARARPPAPCQVASAPSDAAWPVIHSTLAQLGKVWLVAVDAREAVGSRQWWSMMREHHPQGAGPLCGAQLRYLVHSAGGVLGGLSFSAAAWRVAPRDRFIGWDDAARRAGLAKVVANSRFLILPTVRVANLASHVLSLALARLSTDWQARYGICPVLVESFVDTTRYRGTCYRAANWMALGHTQGRGRQDRTHQAERRPKQLWVYALQTGWREQLCSSQALSSQAVPVQRPCARAQDWAEQEFGGCRLEARLQQRLLSLARDFYARPMANVPQACASRAKTKAAYRFFDHDDTSMQTLLQPHYQATQARLAQESIVLAVQDTTSLDYTTHRALQGTGAVGGWLNGPQGLHLHSTLTFNPRGTPLGFLDVQCWARDPQDFGKKARRRGTPIEQKESFKWLKSYRAVAALQPQLPNTVLVSVGDREADVYELFREASQLAHAPKLLIRAAHNRQLHNEQARLWEHLHSLPSAGEQMLQLPRRGSQPARTAHLSIRFAPISLQAPVRDHPHGPAIPVWAVFATEQQPPAGVQPLQWLLLTTLAVESVEQASEKLLWYSRRWGIEVLHRTLKSGCRIEQRQLAHADRLEACLAIDLVVAWRIYHLNKLGREVPQAPCTVCFDAAQWQALMVFTTKNPIPPTQPPSLREAVRRVAQLGGFLGRKGDGEPGTQTLWLGLQRLDDIVAMWRVMADATQPTVSSRFDSG
jgi:hypothetical protein